MTCISNIPVLSASQLGVKWLECVSHLAERMFDTLTQVRFLLRPLILNYIIMPKIKVKQMTSNRSGRPVANQFIIYTSKGRYFQSYDSVIALRDNNGKITLDDYYWDYSRTTSKYRNEFLGEYTADTRAKIESGEYKLKNLNRL